MSIYKLKTTILRSMLIDYDWYQGCYGVMVSQQVTVYDQRVTSTVTFAKYILNYISTFFGLTCISLQPLLNSSCNDKVINTDDGMYACIFTYQPAPTPLHLHCHHFLSLDSQQQTMLKSLVQLSFRNHQHLTVCSYANQISDLSV